MSKTTNKKITLMILTIMIINIFPLFNLNLLNHTGNEVYADGITYNGQTQKGTYTISTSKQLNTLSEKVNSGTTYEGSTFVLTNDIDFGKQVNEDYGKLTKNFTRIGTGEYPFMGTLDGNNKKISNIVIELPEDGVINTTPGLENRRNYVGLIGHLKKGAVKNVNITAFRQVNFTKGRQWHGILVGVNDKGLVENCTVVEDDEHLYTSTYYHDGRLVHVDKTSKSMVWVNYGDIINCHNKYSMDVYNSWTDYDDGFVDACGGITTYNYGNIKSCTNIAKSVSLDAGRVAHGYGGIAHINLGLIENCYNTAKISGMQISGIAGTNSGIIQNCYNKGDIVGSYENYNAAGIASQNNGNIFYCYNEADKVCGSDCTGGIAGNNSGNISYCYNKSNVYGQYAHWNIHGTDVGGIVGEFRGGTINYCYNTGRVGGVHAGGLVGTKSGYPIIKNSYNTGVISTSDPTKGEIDEYPVGDGYVCDGGVLGYNLKHLNSEDYKDDYYREVEYPDYDDEDRPHGKPHGKMKDYGLYTGNMEYNNISNTYYYQANKTTVFSAHIFYYYIKGVTGRLQFPDIHGTDKKYGKTIEEMQSQEFVDLMNAGGDKIYTRDVGETKVNDGFPIFKWQQTVTGIKINGNTNIEDGSFEVLALEVTPQDIEDVTFTWKAEDESIVKVSTLKDGRSAVVKGLKKGFTTITVTANDKNKYSTSIMVKVVFPTIQTKEGYYLVGEEIEYTSQYYDEENDLMYRNEYKYLHNPNYFSDGIKVDNSLGTVNYNDKWLGNGATTFSKVGTYTVYHKALDNPPTANNIGFENYRYYSDSVSTTIYIHRKPIAYFNLKDNVVTDESYDLDHSVSYTNKGIIKWEWTYVNNQGKIEKCVSSNYNDKGLSTVNNWLSTNLGVNYELILRVQDMEYVWSDIYSTNFKGEIEMSANLRTELSEFDLKNGVPASENLLAYDIWTRYPTDLKLQLVLCSKLGVEVATLKDISYSTLTAKKMGQDTYWNDVLYNIPATLKSSNYIMKIKAVDTRDSNVFKEIPFDVNVKTPINLQPIIPNEIRAGKEVELKANTSKYVNNSYLGSGVKVTLFDGTSYARTLNMNGTTSNWDIKTTLDKKIPAGTYTAKFVATLPSGEFEEKSIEYKFVVNTPPIIDDIDIFADIDSSFIYENDDVSMTLRCSDVDLSPIDVVIKLYNNSNSLIKHYSNTIYPNGDKYEPYTLHLIDDIPLGDYRVEVTITDDYGESANATKKFTAHDLWIKGKVSHTEQWEKNRQLYNAKYPGKVRDINTYWSGEAFVTSADTTVIDTRSKVVCDKVSVEIINQDNLSDNHYEKWMLNDNIANDKWSLYYSDDEWLVEDGYVIIKWGKDKKQELTLRFTAYFNNDWVETNDVKIFIDNIDNYWRLHRVW